MKFSFVILTWNRYKFLEKCIEALINSIKNQGNCEILILDNGSTDETIGVLKRFESHPMVNVIRLKKNIGLNAYKKLFSKAKGEYIVDVDDDVLEFPVNVDEIFSDYMSTFSDYGFLALDVVQNEHTNGAKCAVELYQEETINSKTVQNGPTGGWCTCFRKRDYKRIQLRFFFARLNMHNCEDGLLSKLFRKKLGLKSGIIKNIFCFHATGAYYAVQYGHINREVEKYLNSGIQNLVDHYKSFDANKALDPSSINYSESDSSENFEFLQVEE